MDRFTEIKSGITNSGRVWRKVPEGDARCVGLSMVDQTLLQPWGAQEVTLIASLVFPSPHLR